MQETILVFILREKKLKLNRTGEAMNYTPHIMLLVQMVVFCSFLTSCAIASFPDLPGKIVYVVDASNKKPTHNSDIYVMNPDGSDQIRLTAKLDFNFPRVQSPAWSPDGKQIVVSTFDDLGLYIMNADGTDASSIPVVDKDAGSPAWSPNGKEIAYVLGAGGNILFTNLDGTSPQSSFPFAADLLIKDGVFGCNAPSWSPDGRYLTILCCSGKEDKSWNIYKFKADGSYPECLTCASTLEVEFFEPAHWSPDGLQIGFTGWFSSETGDRSMVYVMDPDGKRQRPLMNTQIRGRIQDWAWSPDGQWVVVIEDPWNSEKKPSLQFYKVDGTQSYQIMDLPGRPISVDWGK